MDKRIIKGLGAAPGVIIAPVFKYRKNQIEVSQETIPLEKIDAEILRLEEAIDKASKEIRIIQNTVAKKLSEPEAEIFSAHLFMIQDPILNSETKKLIREKQYNAAFALQEVVGQLFQQMHAIEDEYLRERAVDIVDVGKRILIHLQGVNSYRIKLKQPVIIIAHDLNPSETAQFDRRKVLGIITESGGATSHVAILARALQIPAIVGAEDIFQLVSNGNIVAMDGTIGEAIIAPQPEELKNFYDRQEKFQRLADELEKIKNLPSQTKQGTSIALKINLELQEEIEVLDHFDHDGIGLCRTEFLYLNKTIPDEEAQFDIYSRIVHKLQGKPVVFRTLDVGGDKISPELLPGWEKEPNPFLGVRGIRLSLKIPDTFVVQMKAILRTAVFGPVKIMFPMIAGLSDFIQAKSFLNRAKEELVNEGKAFNPDVEVGIMLEVPSAAITIDILARHVDFISIGTNDLVQYVMASDRMNPEVARLYNPFHPAMIRLLHNVIRTANEMDCPVSVCGELASDDRYFPILIGMGLRELSVSPIFLPKVKSIIRQIDDLNCQNIISRLMAMETIEQVESFLRKQHNEQWRNC